MPGRRVGERRLLEVVRLPWPHWFDGVGVKVDTYDPTGVAQHCVRCGFSILDDDMAGADRWGSGCPECGYDGYLLGLNAGAGSHSAGGRHATP